MERIDDIGYWDAWKSLSEQQRWSVKYQWKKYGRPKEWLAHKLLVLYEENYDDYLMEGYYEAQERKSNDR